MKFGGFVKWLCAPKPTCHWICGCVRDGSVCRIVCVCVSECVRMFEWAFVWVGVVGASCCLFVGLDNSVVLSLTGANVDLFFCWHCVQRKVRASVLSASHAFPRMARDHQCSKNTPDTNWAFASTAGASRYYQWPMAKGQRAGNVGTPVSNI